MSASAARPIPPSQADLCVDDVAESGGKPRILLVDEQAHVLRVMRMNLDRQGYEVDTAQQSESVLEHMGRFTYDALIMTSEMPDTSTQQLLTSALLLCNGAHPLVMVICEGPGEWIDSAERIERLDNPISLRRIVSRLGEAFGQPENQ